MFAIVGGFIATRVMTLASERVTTERRLSEVESNNRELEKRESQLEDDRYRTLLYRATFEVRSRLEDTGRAPPFEEVLKTSESLSVEREHLREAYESLLSDYENARRLVEQHQDKVDPGKPDFHLWLHNTGATNVLPDLELDLELLQSAYNQALRAKGYRPELRFVSSTLPRAPVRDALDEIDDELREVGIRLRETAAQKLLLSERLEQLQPPPNLWWAFGILAYIGAVGVVFPLALLPIDSAGAWLRGLTVGLFGAGLLALGLYMVVQVRPLPELWQRFRRSLRRTKSD